MLMVQPPWRAAGSSKGAFGVEDDDAEGGGQLGTGPSGKMEGTMEGVVKGLGAVLVKVV